MKTINDLLDIALEQIKLDVRCGDYTALQELLKFVPVENLIEYLPEGDWRQFKHLKNNEKDNNS
jgi:hypothetical protein